MRLASGKALYMAHACQERLRSDEGGWTMDADGTGATHYEAFFFVLLADAERWVRWQLAQWPTVVEDNGDVLQALGGIDRVVFPASELTWPQQAMTWQAHPGFEGRMYGEPVPHELEELAMRLAQKATPKRRCERRHEQTR